MPYKFNINNIDLNILLILEVCTHLAEAETQPINRKGVDIQVLLTRMQAK